MSHRFWQRLFSILLLLGLLSGFTIAASANVGMPMADYGRLLNQGEDALAKVEKLVVEEIDAAGQAEFFVWMTEKADLGPAYELETKEEKGRFVFNALVETAERTQKELRAYLDSQGVNYKSFYIANKILVRGGNLELVLAIASRVDVAEITANHKFQLEEPFIKEVGPQAPTAVEPNISFINADDVWTMGIDGSGTVMAGNDTGLDWDHPALINQYRGWDGAIADHNYNWWDATGTYPTVPNDGHGHGTHTTGTMVGDDGVGNQIGVAPGARTVHCKNMTDGGSGSDATFTDCFQWDLAPWDLNGQNPDPDLAPDAINNSWGYGGGGQNQFRDEIQALHAAGILVEVSAGNEGSSCQTLRSPGDYWEVLTTGSVQHTAPYPGTITGFSSRGPSDLDPSPPNYFPDIMAPGENIRSSIPGGSYQGGWSGTSMSGPHATALVGLMWSACPSLQGMVDQTLQLIVDTATPLTGQGGSNCGGDYTTGPNNDWGFGTIDALAAVNAAMVQCTGLGGLDGYVTDNVLEAPIEGATVTAQWDAGGNWSDDTDVSGYYTMTIPNGTYTVTVEHPQYTTQEIYGVSVVTGTLHTENFQLDPKGLLYGYVTDADNGFGLDAMVVADDGTITYTNPATGYYEMYLDEGSYVITATATDYAPGTANVSIVSGGMLLQDFALLRAVSFVPTPLHVTVDWQGTNNTVATLTNNNPWSYDFEFMEIPGGYTPGIEAAWPGPDGYGYVGEVVDFDWVDVAATGTPVLLTDDDWDGPFPVGFDFPLYANTWPDFYIGSNGFVSFGTGSTSLGNQCPLPSATTPDNVIPILWDDLDPGDTGDIVYYQNFGACPVGGGSCLVVQYENYHHYPGGGAIAGTFEAILFENGSVLIQFEDAGAEEGSGSTTGIENANAAADYGMTYACNTASSITDGLAMCFVYPGSSGCLGADIPWFGQEPISGTVPAMDSINPTMYFTATYAAGVDQPGDYYATLLVKGDPSVRVPVTMTVLPSANLGLLEGTVTSDRPGGPLEADILIDDGMGMTWELVTDPDTGYYSFWLEQGNYDVTASAAGYVTQTTGLVINAGLTTTQDFELALDAPEIVVTPVSMEQTVELGSLATQVMTIYNDGLQPLTFEIKDMDSGFVPLAGEDVLVVSYDNTAAAAVEAALTNLGYTYLDVEAAAFTAMPIDELLTYQAVFYMGIPYSAEQTQAIAYMDAGGSFFVADNDVGYSQGGTMFYTTYLQSNYISDSGSDGTVTGMDIMDGIVTDISADPYPDDFTASPEGVGIFQAPSGNLAGIRVERMGYKAIYLAWDFQNTGDAEEMPIVDAALGWLAGADSPWLSEDPIAGTVPAGSMIEVEVTFDAAVVAEPGIYMADLNIKHNDPLNDDVTVPVTMTVQPTVDTAKLQGWVNSLGYCDADSYPLEEAEVYIEASSGMTWTRLTDAGGYYYLWLNAPMHSPVTLTVTYPEHEVGYVADVELTGGMTTTVDFDLRWLVPCVSVAPDSMHVTLDWGLSTMLPLTLTNWGAAPLNFEFREADRGFQPSLAIESQYAYAEVVYWDETETAPDNLFFGIDMWGNGANIPSGARYRSGGTTCDGQTYYIFGGQNSAGTVLNESWQYDPAMDTWTQLANMPVALMNFEATCIGEDIYVVGGYTGSAHTNNFQVYNTATDSWTATTWPNARTPMTTAWGDKLYAFGGNPGPSAETWMYDPGSATWIQLSNMPTANSYGAAITVGDHIYQIGGGLAATVQRYDPSADAWDNSGPQLQDSRMSALTIWYGDYIYVASGGGSGGDLWTGWNTTEVYDPSTWPGGAWVYDDEAVPTPAVGMAGDCADNRMWGAGGTSGGTYYDINQYLDDGLSCNLGGGEVPWLFEDPMAGSVPADGGQLVADITFDSSVPEILQPGDYYADLIVSSDDPGMGNYAVPVTMTVLPSADLGKLEGTVTGLGYCDLDPAPLEGAEVVVESSAGAVWTLTTDVDGYYTFWLLGAVHSPMTVTVSYPDHEMGMEVGVVVSPQMTTTVDFDLRWLMPCVSVDPDAFEVTVGLGYSLTHVLELINAGAADSDFGFSEVDHGFTPGLLGGVAPVITLRERLPNYDANAMSTEGILTAGGTESMNLLGAGDVLAQWPTGDTLNWGDGFDLDNGTVWINDNAAGGGSGLNEEFDVAGNRTGVNWLPSFGGSWPGDMAYNPNTGMFWQVNVGGDNCLYEWDPSIPAATGNTICGPWSISQRGVAYDPETDTYYVGGWNDDTVWHIDNTGALIESWPMAGGISGMAFNTEADLLFIMENSTTDTVSVFDVALGTVVDSFTVAGFGNYVGAGLAIDCDGNLWAVNQGNNNAYLIDSGVPASLCVATDIPWLFEDPVTGTVGADSSFFVDLIFDASVVTQTGTYSGTLVFSSDDPVTDTIEIPVTMNVVEPAYGVDLSGDMAQEGVPGEVVTFTMTVTSLSNGPMDTFSLTLGSSVYPSSLSVSEVGPLAPGGTAEFQVMVTIPATALVGEFDMVEVTVTSQGDPTQTDMATLTTTVGGWPISDMAITKVATPDPVMPGETVTYTLDVVNNGPDIAVDVTLTDTLSAGVTFVSASAGCVEASGVVSCDLGNMATGESASVVIVVTAPDTEGVITNTAEVGNARPDPDLTNNTASVDVDVVIPGYQVYLPFIARN